VTRVGFLLAGFLALTAFNSNCSSAIIPTFPANAPRSLTPAESKNLRQPLFGFALKTPCRNSLLMLPATRCLHLSLRTRAAEMA
jgi:hypothetical protein